MWGLIKILGFLKDVWWGFRNSKWDKGLIIFSKFEEYGDERKVNGVIGIPSSWMPPCVKVHLGMNDLLLFSYGWMLEVVSSLSLDEIASNILMEVF